MTFGLPRLTPFFLLLAAFNALAQQPITLSSPRDYQIFQRLTRDRGFILIRGHLSAPADHIEVRVVEHQDIMIEAKDAHPAPSPSSKWFKLVVNKVSGGFEAPLPTPAGGFYDVELRTHRGHTTDTQLTVTHVGVGEVFLISGQSNSTNYGEVPQTTQIRMVTTFDGSSWRIADDPQPGTQDSSRKGSFAPSFGDALFARYHVPIAIASVGHGSTSIRQWLPAGDNVEVMPTMTRYVTRNPDGSLTSTGALFNGMLNRIHQLEASAPPGGHGLRAILWHQGESDSHQPPEHEIPASTYRRMLERVIASTRSAAGWPIPFFVAQATYHTPNDTSTPAIRQAQQSLWQDGIALEGPDTDTLGPPYRQNNGTGTHLNDAGLKLHGQLWAQAVEAWLDKLLN
jgi:hypothetical protein